MFKPDHSFCSEEDSLQACSLKASSVQACLQEPQTKEANNKTSATFQEGYKVY